MDFTKEVVLGKEIFNMTEPIIAAIIGAAISLITTILILSVNTSIERNKMRVEIQQKKEEAKREKLTDIYTELVSIINSFPKESPNNALEYIEYPPHYSMESFDSIIDILNYQIEDYKQLLENKNISINAKSHNETQIRKRDYAIEQVLKIKEDYCNARDRYRTFCKTKKMIFDLYAGQDVKNSIVEFDVLIYNVFISGHRIDDAYDPRYNKIEVARRNIIDSMRNDIGLN